MRLSPIIKPSTGICLFLVTASLSVCTILFGKFDWIILFFCVFLSLPFVRWQHYRPSRLFRYITLLFYIPFLISLCWSFVLISIVNDVAYNNYITSPLIFRTLHVALFYLVLFYSDTLISHKPRNISIHLLSVFVWGVIIFLGLFGLWQILGSLTGVWVPQIETRNALYSARALGINRVTSLADEPSYLVPFLIDAILILLLFKKKKLALLLGFLLVMSLSFGGFMESAVLLSAYVLMSSKATKVKVVALIMTSICIFIIAFPDLVDIIVQIVLSRKELQAGFDPSQTSRTAMIVYPIEKWSEFDFVSLAIGYGPGSSKYLLEANPSEALFVTSNNVFADLLYEEGLIGVAGLVILFVLFWRNTYSYEKRIKIFVRLFVIHIILSSLYRADYSSARYTALFIILLALHRLFSSKNRSCNPLNLSTLDDNSNTSDISAGKVFVGLS